MLLLFPVYTCDIFICVLPSPHQDISPTYEGRHLHLLLLLCLAPNRVSVKDCTHDPAPRDHTTQDAYKKHFKLKKVRSISAQTGTNRGMGPSSACNVVTPTAKWVVGQTPRKAQTAEARVLVPLGVASGPVGSEVRLPETCSVQGVPVGEIRWVNMATGPPTSWSSQPFPSSSSSKDPSRIFPNPFTFILIWV